MKTITLSDIQYAREQHYFKKLQKDLKAGQALNEILNIYRKKKYSEFFNLLSTAIKLDMHPDVQMVIQGISVFLGKNKDIHVFLYQNALPDARCYTRNNAENKKEELIILVSQHFFNDLTTNERMAILGHELAHQLFSHTSYPKNFILDGKYSEEVKSDVLKWSICCEISCDVVGYIAAGYDADAFNSAMIKFTTGITSGKQQLLDPTFIKLVLEQYQQINDSIHTGALASHPITPLRIKLIDDLSNSPLLRHYNRIYSGDIDKLKNDYNNQINTIIKDVYPELFPLQGGSDNIALNLCKAVILADRKIDEKEISFLIYLFKLNDTTQNLKKNIEKQTLDSGGVRAYIQQLIEESVALTVSNKLLIRDVHHIIRTCLLMAVADGRLQAEELDCIYDYASRFRIKKLKIINIMNQMRL